MLAGNSVTNSHLSKIYLLIAKFWRWQTLQLVGRIFWVRKMKSERRGIEWKLLEMYLLIAKSKLIEIGLKVVFAIYQVQLQLQLAPYQVQFLFCFVCGTVRDIHTYGELVADAARARLRATPAGCAVNRPWGTYRRAQGLGCTGKRTR